MGYFVSPRERIFRVRITNRQIAVLGAIVATAGLAACGGAGSGKIVAQVAGVGSITETTLDHWTTVEAVLLYDQAPTGPVPKGVVPDPPSYTACIAYLRSTGQTLVENGAKPTAAQFKSRCAQQLRSIRLHVLNTLIGWYWTLGKGAELGMRVSEADVRRRFTEVNDRLFPHNAQFKSYMAQTGQTVADLMLRARVQLFEVKGKERLTAIEKSLPAKLTAQQRLTALRNLVESGQSVKRWVAKTSCREGFVTPDCKQYKGSLPPE
jgi:foldase protein PrsA